MAGFGLPSYKFKSCHSDYMKALDFTAFVRDFKGFFASNLQRQIVRYNGILCA